MSILQTFRTIVDIRAVDAKDKTNTTLNPLKDIYYPHSAIKEVWF